MMTAISETAVSFCAWLYACTRSCCRERRTSWMACSTSSSVSTSNTDSNAPAKEACAESSPMADERTANRHEGALPRHCARYCRATAHASGRSPSPIKAAGNKTNPSGTGYPAWYSFANTWPFPPAGVNLSSLITSAKQPTITNPIVQMPKRGKANRWASSSSGRLRVRCHK